MNTTVGFSKRYHTKRPTSDNEPKWVDLDLFIKTHKLMIEVMDRKQYIRDIGLLESAFQRPKFMFFFYDKASLLERPQVLRKAS